MNVVLPSWPVSAAVNTSALAVAPAQPSVAHMIRRLRPELVRRNPLSLSSDAYSLFEDGRGEASTVEDTRRPLEVRDEVSHGRQLLY